MSPEQARGSMVDKRCDIWSFGVVLFEMLAGKQLFAGQTISDTIAAVLRAEVDWNILPRDTPASIRVLLRRCLIKDRKQRLQAIGEARIAIEEYLADPAAHRFLPRRCRPQEPLIAWSVAIICLVGALRCLWLAGSRRSTGNSSGAQHHPHLIRNLAISPDGRLPRWPQASRNAPDARSSDNGTAGTSAQIRSGARQPVDGFFAEGKLRRIDIAGGLPQALANAETGHGTWSRDGIIVFTPSQFRPLYRVPAAGGEPVAITRLDPLRQFMHNLPQFLPDGRHFLYAGQFRGFGHLSGIA
jgi:serine/threonine-protein kinase